jgi:formylglycine-generating enzyme
MNAPSFELSPCFPEAWACGWGQDRFGLWQEFEVGGAIQRLRWIPPGEFDMGAPPDDPDREIYGFDESLHRVVLTQGFWLADTACTQALWDAVLRENPSRFRGGERPVEQVSWVDVVSRFLPALNALVPGLGAALPTESQWEYACRAGTETPFAFGRTLTTDQANYDGNYPYSDSAKGEYRQRTVEVKTFPPNAWGLYQMHGNVREWCSDWLGDYPREPTVDPTGPADGRERVLRGGSWSGNAWLCRSAYRFGRGPGHRSRSFGFRLSRGAFPRPAKRAGSADAAGAAATPERRRPRLLSPRDAGQNAATWRRRYSLPPTSRPFAISATNRSMVSLPSCCITMSWARSPPSRSSQ